MTQYIAATGQVDTTAMIRKLYMNGPMHGDHGTQRRCSQGVCRNVELGRRTPNAEQITKKPFAMKVVPVACLRRQAKLRVEVLVRYQGVQSWRLVEGMVDRGREV
jgi:hypothetical protein